MQLKFYGKVRDYGYTFCLVPVEIRMDEPGQQTEHSITWQDRYLSIVLTATEARQLYDLLGGCIDLLKK